VPNTHVAAVQSGMASSMLDEYRSVGYTPKGCGLVVLRPNLTHGTKGSFRLDALGSRQGFRVFFVAWGASFLI